jgi:hypothetical protein
MGGISANGLIIALVLLMLQIVNMYWLQSKENIKALLNLQEVGRVNLQMGWRPKWDYVFQNNVD